MRKYTPIRITKNDKAEYQRLVRNTKAKIKRTSKNYGIDLSADIDLPPLEEFKTRKDFNEWKQRQASFTNRSNLNYQFKKNDFGVVASKKRLANIERMTKEAQRQANETIKTLENLPFNVGGKKNGSLRERMALLGETNVTGIRAPKDFNFDKIRGQWELRRKEQQLLRKSEPMHYDKRADTMKENFATRLLETFNSDAEELYKRLMEMDSWEFFKMYMSEANIDFDFIYPDRKGFMKDSVDKINSYVDKYENQVDDLKNF